MPEEYPRTGSNSPSRHPERARYDAATVHSILDAGIVAHVGFVVEGRPRVLPLLYVRVGECLYLHGSTGARLNRTAAREGGIPLCAEVTVVDGLVLARSVFDHSANYRSVVVFGEGRLVQEEAEKERFLAALVERLLPGRSGDARGPRPDELRQTAVLALPLGEVSAKVRSGDPVDEPEDLALQCWAGVLPIEARFGVPQRAADLAPHIELPDYLARLEGVALPT